MSKGPLAFHNSRGKRSPWSRGYFYQDFLERDYPDIEVELVADVPTGLTKVAFGTADAMIVNLAVATYYIQDIGLTNLRVSGRTAPDYDGRYAFATRNDWPELSLILDKALLQIGAGPKNGDPGEMDSPGTSPCVDSEP